MSYALIFIFSFFMLCPQTAVFARPVIKVRASVDKRVVNVDEFITYKLTVISSEKNVPTKIPEFENFTIISREESVSFRQDGAQTTRVFVFNISPQKTGKLEIEKAEVTFLGRVHQSRGFKIKVLPSGTLKPEDTEPQEDLDLEIPAPEDPAPQKWLGPEIPDYAPEIPLPGNSAPQEEPGPEIPDSGQSQYNL